MFVPDIIRFDQKSHLLLTAQAFVMSSELERGSFMISSPAERPLAYIVTAFLFLLVIYNTTSQKKARVPELNPPKSRIRLPGYVGADQAQDFVRNSKDLMVAGRAKFPDEPYRLYSYLGDSIVVPPNLINEIRNEPSLDMQESATIVGQTHSPLRVSQPVFAKLETPALGLPRETLRIRSFRIERKDARRCYQVSDKSTKYVLILVQF